MQRRTLVPLAALALAILGVATAVTSAAGTVQTMIKGGPGEGEGIYKVSGGKILPVNGQITVPSTFKCNTSTSSARRRSSAR
jgi:hypothetical protein